MTAAEAEAGEAIEICLDEIDACRPHFIAILGRRYGWIDPHAPVRLARRHPHLAAFADRSITELEIRHAVLDPPAHLPPAQATVYVRADALDAPLDGERRSVAALIEELKGAGCPVRTFADPLAPDAHQRVSARIATRR